MFHNILSNLNFKIFLAEYFVKLYLKRLSKEPLAKSEGDGYIFHQLLKFLEHLYTNLKMVITHRLRYCFEIKIVSSIWSSRVFLSNFHFCAETSLGLGTKFYWFLRISKQKITKVHVPLNVSIQT